MSHYCVKCRQRTYHRDGVCQQCGTKLDPPSPSNDDSVTRHNEREGWIIKRLIRRDKR